MPDKKKLNPILKLVLDIGPLVLFFAANAKFGIFAATGAFMVAALIALAVAYTITRRIEVMPIITAIIVVIFGGLTLLLHDELFIKLIGPYIGETLGRARSVVHFDPMVAAARNRPTAVAITGEPGGGKTTLAMLLIYQLALRGSTIAVSTHLQLRATFALLGVMESSGHWPFCW